MNREVEDKRNLLQESVFVPVGNDADRLHLRRFRRLDRPVLGSVLLLHGAIENGRIFYSLNGEKGLAPFLADQGFDVFVADLRGRGGSRPSIHRHSDFGQTEAINEDLTAFVRCLEEQGSRVPQHWIAHSWGGVLMASHLLRFPEHAKNIASLSFFGSKRSISVWNWRKLIAIDLLWNRLALLATALWGYLPARTLRMGSDSESSLSLAQSVFWVSPRNPWVDPGDGFDYRAAVPSHPLPRTLAFAGPKDYYLGHPHDVQRFVLECGLPPESVHLLAKSHGHKHDYGHLDMLMHPDALTDHFPQLVAWLKDAQRPRVKPSEA